MNKILLFFDRILKKIIREYRRYIFLAKIKYKTRNIKILGKIYLNATNVKVGDNVSFYPGVYLWGDGEIIIGDNVDIGVGTIIFSKNRIVIGNDVSIAGQCYIIDCNHTTKKEKTINSQELDCAEEGIVIEDDVWIAAGSKIIKGASIKKGAVIGAMSLVNSVVSSYCIAVGIPAKIIDNRK